MRLALTILAIVVALSLLATAVAVALIASDEEMRDD
jgi:hypothetical protein